MPVRSQLQNKKMLQGTTTLTRAILCIILLLFVSGGATLEAQLFTGSINGVVRDPTQSAIPGRDGHGKKHRHLRHPYCADIRGRSVQHQPAQSRRL